MNRSAIRKDDLREHSIEATLGGLLRGGVLISSGTIFLGGVLNLLRHGNEPFSWEHFHGEPAALRTISGIADAAMAAQGKGIIQFGLILLIAVPVLRVAVSAVVFIWERDFLFAALTLLVLAVLFYSFLLAS